MEAPALLAVLRFQIDIQGMTKGTRRNWGTIALASSNLWGFSDGTSGLIANLSTLEYKRPMPNALIKVITPVGTPRHHPTARALESHFVIFETVESED